MSRLARFIYLWQELESTWLRFSGYIHIIVPVCMLVLFHDFTEFSLVFKCGV